MAQTIRLEVTQEDIDGAGYGSTCCPIARAILRTFVGTEGAASVGADECGFYRQDAEGNYQDGPVWRGILPPEGRQLAADWDKTFFRPDWRLLIHPVAFDVQIIAGEVDHG